MSKKPHICFIKRKWRALGALRRVDCRRRRTAMFKHMQSNCSSGRDVKNLLVYRAVACTKPIELELRIS